MKISSPQLSEPRRERIEAALDIAVAALHRIAGRPAADPTPDSTSEVARKALTSIEAILPQKVQRR
jgi:hypothetical protein